VATRVVIVCTANRCRSPLAAELLRSALAARGVPIRVDSAGLGAPGLPATDETVQVAARRGLDLTAHRSERLAADAIAGADLVLAMERRHVRDAVVAVPSAWPYTFTVKELVRRAEAVGPRPAAESFPAWIARVHEGRERSALQGASPIDDLADPTGGTLAEHEDTARELEDLLTRLVACAWPEAEPAESSAAP
jgi:protein-tyrosine phosphatase